ncbi:MAG: adenine phosphoribosyltransferase [Candidatus ainarchaeum sp.]|nr:adenine phosphoribosyltransferase [Candidatus ainarchaeum sp.]
MTESIKNKIRTIPNFPKQGIMFRDITTLLKDKDGLREVVEILEKKYKDIEFDYVVGIESRGFIIGGILAHKLGIGFIPIRKKGKLPSEVIKEEYDLEYGKDVIEIHKDSLKKGDKILLLDDLIATGGTALASCKLIEKVGAIVEECASIIDLPELGGSKKINDYLKKNDDEKKVFSIVQFEGE